MTPRVTGCLAAALLWLGSVSSSPAEEVLEFCYDPYPPYTLGERGAPSGGLKVKLLEAVMSRIDGLSATVVLLPWKRCQEEARVGNLDGILPLFVSAERENYLAFSDATLMQPNAFFFNRAAHPDGIDWQGGYDQISSLRLGMVQGSLINQEMEAAFTAVNPIQRSGSIEGLFQMLFHDRLDLVAVDQHVGRYIAEVNGWGGQLIPLRLPISQRASHFGLSRASGADRHLAALNQAIAALYADGTIKMIQNDEVMN